MSPRIESKVLVNFQFNRLRRSLRSALKIGVFSALMGVMLVPVSGWAQYEDDGNIEPTTASTKKKKTNFNPMDRMIFKAGFVYEFITLQQKLARENSNVLPFYGLTGSLNYILLHSNDVVSLGINPNLNVALSYSSIYGISAMGQGPIFLLGKYGAGATKFNEQKFGIGVGIGGSYTYIYYQIQTVEINQGFFTPNALVEVSLKTGRSSYTLRGTWSLLPAEHDLLLSGSTPSTFRWGNLGFSLISTF